MQGRITVVVVAFALLVGFGLGNLAAQKKAKPSIMPSVWQGKSAAEAAAAMLETATVFAAEGSWENIHVGRVYYLSGDKDTAEAIFQRYQGGSKPNPGDLARIARVYAQAGDWDKAAPLYDKVLGLKANDADWMAEAGAWYNLNGDRERAETLFEQSFALESRSLNNTLNAAGSYVGVEPRKR